MRGGQLLVAREVSARELTLPQCPPVDTTRQQLENFLEEVWSRVLHKERFLLAFRPILSAGPRARMRGEPALFLQPVTDRDEEVDVRFLDIVGFRSDAVTLLVNEL